MRLLLAFIAVPLIEIGLFIQVGDYIGLWPTLLIVFLTAVIGTSLVRNQGIQALVKLQSAFVSMRDPTEPLAHGAMILLVAHFCLHLAFLQIPSEYYFSSRSFVPLRCVGYDPKLKFPTLILSLKKITSLMMLLMAVLTKFHQKKVLQGGRRIEGPISF